MSETVAFIGTGLMGTPMVRRLLRAGLEVRIWNRSPDKAEALRDAGAWLSATPSEAILGATIVCLCLTDASVIQNILFGEYAAAQAIGDDTIIVDFSTIGPDATLDITRHLKTVSPAVQWVDAPVTGGVKGAETGELVILCGGDARSIDRLGPVFEPLSRRVCRLGPLGSGQAAKLCNQLIVALNVLAIAEALSLGRQFGLDLPTLPKVLENGWADSAPLQIIGDRMARGQLEPPIVATGTFAKDLKLIMDNGSAQLELSSCAHRIFKNAIAEGLGKTDVAALLGFVEQQAK